MNSLEVNIHFILHGLIHKQGSKYSSVKKSTPTHFLKFTNIGSSIPGIVCQLLPFQCAPGNAI